MQVLIMIKVALNPQDLQVERLASNVGNVRGSLLSRRLLRNLNSLLQLREREYHSTSKSIVCIFVAVEL